MCVSAFVYICAFLYLRVYLSLRERLANAMDIYALHQKILIISVIILTAAAPGEANLPFG